MKCPDCARLPRSALRMGRPRYYLAAAGTGLGVSIVLGATLTFFNLGLFGILLPMLIGLLVGSVVSRAARGLGHRPFQLIAAFVTVVGLLAGPLLIGVPAGAVLQPGTIFGLVIAGAVAAIRVGS